jgi:hypothetical protein
MASYICITIRAINPFALLYACPDLFLQLLCICGNADLSDPYWGKGAVMDLSRQLIPGETV